MKFNEIYNHTPRKLKIIIDKCKSIKQNPIWHPEIFVYIHTQLVTDRLSVYNDINLILAGLFHDLGKVKSTVWDEEKKSWTAHGHEDESAKIMNHFKYWVEEMGGNPEIVEFIIKNHMRIKYLDDFRFQEKMRFLNEPLFDYVHKFASADFGGTDLECKPLQDLSKIEDEITEFNKQQEINKKVSSKFNGKIIMDLYPELKGKPLGNAINGFKKFVAENFGDFNEYIISNSKGTVIDIFNVFYKDVLNK